MKNKTKINELLTIKGKYDRVASATIIISLKTGHTLKNRYGDLGQFNVEIEDGILILTKLNNQ